MAKELNNQMQVEDRFCQMWLQIMLFADTVVVKISLTQCNSDYCVITV